MSELVADVVALADTAGLPTFHLVTHDWGGAVGWAMAAEAPERLRTLTVMSTPHPAAMVAAVRHSDQGRRSWYMVLFQLPWLPEIMLTVRRGRLAERSLISGGMHPEETVRPVQAMQSLGAATGAVNWYRAIPFSRPGGAARITVPTLYVWSTEDIALGRYAAEHTGDFVDGPYRFEVLDGATHWFPQQEPGRTAELVLSHIAT